MSSSENFKNILNLPNKLLLKIFKLSENNKNLSLTCKKFHELIHQNKKKNFLMSVDYRYLINPAINFDKILQSSNKFDLNYVIKDDCQLLNNFEAKFEYFLHQYGNKIKSFTISHKIENFITKFLPLMPNLEELILKDLFSLEKSNTKIKLKTLKFFYKIEVENLENFKFDKLVIDLMYFKEDNKKIYEIIKEHKSLKVLKIINTDYYDLDYIKLLKNLKLEILELHAFSEINSRPEICLKNQIFLKELLLPKITGFIFESICDNLKLLEKLSFSFIPKTPATFLKNLSKLKNLKFLKIKSLIHNEELHELSLVNLEKLESLDIKIFNNFQHARHEIEKLSENLNSLKSLTVQYQYYVNFDIVMKIFKNFNNLESLNLNFSSIRISDEDEEFLKTCHKNENLKNLTFLCLDIKKEDLVKKFIKDFPNLEFIDLGKYNNSKKILELILRGFKRLKKFENFKHNEKYLEIFLKYGQNIEEFEVDLNILKEPMKFLENCKISTSIEDFNSIATITRNKKELNVDLNFLHYLSWKSFKTFDELKISPKHLTLTLNLDEFRDKFLRKLLKVFGKNVTHSTVSGFFGVNQLAKIVENLPNLKNLFFQNFFVASVLPRTENFYVQNTKIKTICLKLDMHFESLEYELPKITVLTEKLKFPEQSIKNFKIFVKNLNDEDHKDHFRLWIKKLIKDQNNLTKIEEFFIEETLEYVFEVTEELKVQLIKHNSY